MTRSLAHLNRALQAAFGTQELAAACGCSENSARRYRNGYAVPNVVLLARLMRQSRSFAMAFWEYVGLDAASLDADSARTRAEFAKLMAEYEALNADYRRLLAAYPEYSGAAAVPAGAVGDPPGPADDRGAAP